MYQGWTVISINHEFTLNKQCTCKNLSTLIDMVDLFDEIGEKYLKQLQPKTTRMQREKAAKLVDKLLPVLTEKDMVPRKLYKSTVNEIIERVKKYRREYIETGSSDAIYAMDDIRALIHLDEGIRAKILCQKQYHSKENTLLYLSMQTLRGEGGTSKDSKNIIRSLYNNITCTTVFGEKN